MVRSRDSSDATPKRVLRHMNFCEMKVHGEPRRLLARNASEIETVPENHLCDQMIRGARDTYTQPKIHLPLGR